MSQTDSFIEEVTEEVRKDRLFSLIRRFGWLAVLVVFIIVGAAAWNEWNKAEARASAQATGDALLAAVEANDDAARIVALKNVKVGSAEAQVLADFLLATHQVIVGEAAAAGDSLDAVVTSSGDIPEIYRQIAAFKSVVARGSTVPVSERREALEALAAPGMPLSLLAQEQIALLDVEEGDTASAITKLNALVLDANVSAGLRQRATQLIVALGGAPAGAENTAIDQ